MVENLMQMKHGIQAFAPGRVVAGGDLRDLRDTNESGTLRVRFLRGPSFERENTKRKPCDIAIIESNRPIPEIELLIQACAFLSNPIRRGEAIVDFDYYMKYVGLPEIAYQLGIAGRSLIDGFQSRSHRDSNQLSSIRESTPFQAASSNAPQATDAYLSTPISRDAFPFVTPCNYWYDHRSSRPIAIIDSGLDPQVCTPGRIDSIIDLSEGAPKLLNLNQSIDSVGHGSRVVRILDAVTEQTEQKFLIASLGPERNVTASAVAMAMTCCMDGIPETPRNEDQMPFVVSMSLHPLVEGGISLHQPLLLPFFASRYPNATFVMAAGNSGDCFPVSRNANNLYYGAALDKHGSRPKYCSIPNDPWRTLSSFGGCPNHRFFEGADPFGTSWSTPLTAATLDSSLRELSGLHPSFEYEEINNGFRRMAIRHHFRPSPLGWIPSHHHDLFAYG